MLFPDRPTTPGTLQVMAGQPDGEIATLEHPPQIKERYPLLPSGSYGTSSNAERKPVQEQSSFQQRRASSPRGRQEANTRKTSDPQKERANSNKGANRDAGSASKRLSSSPSNSADLHPNATAAEKSSQDVKIPKEPRQTRTSSLRARLSGGRTDKESASENKELGIHNSSLHNQIQERNSSGSVALGTEVLSKKTSKESLYGRRPAQFVAGSRRPPSRGSLRSESRTSAHSTSMPPPVRAAPSIPSVGVDSPFVKSSVKHSNVEAVPRKSSLPVFQHTVSDVVSKADAKPTIPDNNDVDLHAGKAKISSQDFGIFEDNDSQQSLALAAIEESPRSGYHVKRLSVTSPQHGPTLKISPSADRLIMGTGSDKENELANEKKKTKDMGRVLTTDLHSSSRTKAPMRPLTKPEPYTRPSSSQGLSLSASRPKLMNSETREKKAKSADIGTCLSLDHLVRLAGKENPESSRKNMSASTTDDPFFDAQSSLDKRVSHATVDERDLPEQHGLLSLDTKSWVEPVQKHLIQTADRDASLLPADVTTVFTDEIHVHDWESSNKENVPPTVGEIAASLPKDLSSIKRTPPKATEDTPLTPEPMIVHVHDSDSGSHPPRSSSRTAHPNFAAKKLSPSSPLVNKEHVPQGFTDRQNRLGSLRGHGTSQVDITAPNSHRTSVAQESNISQGSTSKGVLSKVGGLFHKRNSNGTNGSLKVSKKNKQKASVASNGSPFPPISEVHPIHRPTLSSMRRANGNAPRSSLPDFAAKGASTPILNSPIPTEVSQTTTLAMQILESARNEGSSPKKERLLELGKIMVDAITQAREAEKAMEEAKQAARKAEVAHALCQKSIGDISKLIVDWRDDMGRGSSR